MVSAEISPCVATTAAAAGFFWIGLTGVVGVVGLCWWWVEAECTEDLSDVFGYFFAANSTFTHSFSEKCERWRDRAGEWDKMAVEGAGGTVECWG